MKVQLFDSAIDFAFYVLLSRFAAKLASSGALVLASVELKASTVHLRVSTERAVIGAMLLRDLKTALA